MGALIFDGLCDGIFLFNQGSLSHAVVDATAFGILRPDVPVPLRQNIYPVPVVAVRFTTWRRQLPVQGSHFTFERLEDRHYGLYREWSRRDGGC